MPARSASNGHMDLHATVLLTLSDVASRASAQPHSDVNPIGVLFGLVNAPPKCNEALQAFELPASTRPIDIARVAEHAELLRAVDSRLRLIGWFCQELEPELHQQLQPLSPVPLTAIQVCTGSETPIKGSQLTSTGEWTTVSIGVVADDAERIVMSDTLAGEGPSLDKVRAGAERVAKKKAIIVNYLKNGQDKKLLARAKHVLTRLEAASQPLLEDRKRQEAEEEATLAQLAAAIIMKADKYVALQPNH